MQLIFKLKYLFVHLCGSWNRAFSPPPPQDAVVMSIKSAIVELDAPC